MLNFPSIVGGKADDDLAQKMSLLTGALRTLIPVDFIGVLTAVAVSRGVRLAISPYISAERPQNLSLPVRLFTLFNLLHVLPWPIVFFMGGEIPIGCRVLMPLPGLGRWCII